MELFQATASPFVRTVRVAIVELGLTDRVSLVDTKVSPVEANTDYAAVNPLRLIPALKLDDGTVLTDSTTILLYLNEIGGGDLLPAGQAKWIAMTRYSTAKGVMDQLVGLRYETALRPAELQWRHWIDDRKDKVRSALKALANSVEPAGDILDLAQIGLGSALGYLDFRFADWPWREHHPSLAEWYAGVALRSSFKASAPA